METNSPYSWIALKFRLGTVGLRTGLQPLWVLYEDSLGNSRPLPRTSATHIFNASWNQGTRIDLFSQEFDAYFDFIIPPDFHELIENLLLHRSNQPGRYPPTSLPIFVEAPRNFEAFKFRGEIAWENIAESLVQHFTNERIQTVLSSGKNKGIKGTPFALPYRILAVGKSCQYFTQSLRELSWYRNIAKVQNHGIVFGDYSLEEITAETFKNQWDVVLADGDSIERILNIVKRVPIIWNSRPRLIIYFDEQSHEFAVRNLKIPSGIAFLWKPVNLFYPRAILKAQDFFKQLFYEIIHDKPLHEALRLAVREQRDYEPRKKMPLLIADPNSNNSLRISDALIKLTAQEKQIRKWHRLGDLDQFIERTAGEIDLSLREQLFSVKSSRQNIAKAVHRFNDFKKLSFDYGSEYESIVTLSDIAETLTVAKKEDVKISQAVAAVVQNPAFVEEIRKHLERRVDIAVSRNVEKSAYETLDGSEPLLTGERYRARIHIGHRLPESLMMGDLPPVDPLLPDSNNGHRLEIAFFEKDFVALSPTVQPLFLPDIGGSDSVFFEFRSPQRVGVAEARIGVYYENHLLQSFLLTANVTTAGETLPPPLKIKLFVASGGAAGADTNDSEKSEERWIETVTDKQVLARLVFTRTARFTNLEELGRREISIGLNSDAGGVNHTFTVKVDGKARSFNVPEKILDQQTEIFRKFLVSNLANGKKPLFPTEPVRGDESKESFKAALRNLMKLGESLYDRLFSSLPEMQDKLRELANAEDETIQIIRHDNNYVFPWLALYDYQLPTPLAGATAPPVCLGYEENFDSATDDGAPTKKCSHKPTDDIYCVYGLWGLRHQVEQLVDLTGEPKDATTRIVPAGNSIVQLAVGTKDAYSSDLATKISRELGTFFKEFDTSEDLIDLMWNDTDRPAILIVLGHQQIQTVISEPDEPRIVLIPSKKWLLARDIMKRLKITQKWSQQPSTLVLLMACSAGATELSTLSNFVTALTSAGAGAVAGTECLVFSSMAARFAREVTIDMWNEKTLGEAVKLFYRRLMTRGNPAAFAFNYLGDAGLTIDKNPLGRGLS